MKESELTTKPVDVDTTYDFFSLKAMNMDTTLERGGAYDYFSLDCIKIVDYGVPPPHFDTVFFAEILNEGNDSTVYGGHLLDEHGNNVHEIIIKLGKLEQMQREAENYVRLRSLQGRVIPYMFCYCVADRGNGNGHWGCLVIERFGAQLDVPIEYMEIPEQATLLNHFRDIHNEGLTHNDFESRNILQKDKEFRVIDLESLTVHVCTKCTMDFVTISSEEDGYVPLWCLCPPLRVAVEDLGFCGFDKVLLAEYKFTKTKNLPSLKMMYALFPLCMRTRYDHNAEFEEFLSQYYQRMYQKMVELGLEDKKESVARLGQEAPQIFTNLESMFSSRLKLRPDYGRHRNGLGYMSIWPVPEDVVVS